MGWLETSCACAVSLYHWSRQSGPAQEKDLHNVEFTPGVGQELCCVARACGLGFSKNLECGLLLVNSASQTCGMWGGGCVSIDNQLTGLSCQAFTPSA